MKIINKTLIILCITMCMLFGRSYANSSPTLKVGFIQSPNYFISDDYSKIGFEYDILQNFALIANKKLKVFTYSDKESLVHDVNKGIIDIAAGHLTNYLAIKNLNKLFFSEPINTEKMAIVTYQLHSQSTVNYPKENDKVYSFKGDNFSKLYDKSNFTISQSNLNPQDLYYEVSKGYKQFAIMPLNVAKSFIQIYPTTKIFIDNNSVNNIFYIRDYSLRKSFNKFIINFKEKEEYSYIKHSNFNPLSRHHREESRLFIINMKNKFPQYRSLFQRLSTEMDYRLVMGVGYQESRWRPDAVSPWGPSGFMMLTNASAKILGVKNKLNATESITAGVGFLMRLKHNLTSEIKGEDRDMFAITNYNIGIARIIDARTWLKSKKLNPNSWVVLSKNYPIMEKDNHKHGKINGTWAAQYMEGVRHWYWMIVNYLHFYKN